MSSKNTINKFSIKSLDYDEIKADLKTFLQSQDQFTDYDFEGSGLSQIINLLALNTHYNNVYDSFTLNESFIDTAIKRSSVISHAGLLNYIPRSARCPVAHIKLVARCTGDSSSRPSILTISAYSKFTAQRDDNIYNFYTVSDTTAQDDGNGMYVFEDIALYGGELSSIAQTFNGDYFQCFKLDSQNIDTTTINVLIDSESDGVKKYVCSTDVLDANGSSLIYFLKMNADETMNIQFGNGVLGAALKNGDIVYIRYLVSYGENANKIDQFEYSGSLGSTYSISAIVCTSSSVGGAEAETTEEVRFNAPRVFGTQNRLVTVEDYKSILYANYPSIRCLNVWGGEDMDPPQYGKTFISVIKNDNTTLTDDEKEYIKTTIIKPKAIPTTIVEFSDPTYIGVRISSVVYFDPKQTTEDANSIASSVEDAIIDFCDANIGGFNQTLKYSKLLSEIDNTDQSIMHNMTSIKLSFEFTPNFDTKTSYEFTFGNAIKHQTKPVDVLASNGFYCAIHGDNPCYFDDDPTTGRIRIYQGTQANKTIVNPNAGTIDYNTGKIVINELVIKSNSSNSNIVISVIPENSDIVSSSNQFAILDAANLNVTAIAES